MSGITREDIERRLQAFYTDEEIETWMRLPQMLLHEKSADEMIAQGDADKVLAVVRQLEDLVYL